MYLITQNLEKDIFEQLSISWIIAYIQDETVLSIKNN